jgi:hypothetical protein
MLASQKQAAERLVERGWVKLAAYFEDEPYWWRKIDIDKIDQSSSDMCVVAQLFGHDYEYGIECLGFDLSDPIDYKMVTEHGYTLPATVDIGWYALNQSWREKIRIAN